MKAKDFQVLQNTFSFIRPLIAKRYLGPIVIYAYTVRIIFICDYISIEISIQISGLRGYQVIAIRIIHACGPRQFIFRLAKRVYEFISSFAQSESAQETNDFCIHFWSRNTSRNLKKQSICKLYILFKNVYFGISTKL